MLSFTNRSTPPPPPPPPPRPRDLFTPPPRGGVYPPFVQLPPITKYPHWGVYKVTPPPWSDRHPPIKKFCIKACHALLPVFQSSFRSFYVSCIKTSSHSLTQSINQSPTVALQGPGGQGGRFRRCAGAGWSRSGRRAPPSPSSCW